MNRLQHETSPYLLQHANNPVDWYAWKPEALERAKREDKPILVSIGYSTCHWCHVMERESFEDEATAAFMNEHFVNIKVDREERPDVDKIYMEACQAINGSGGWPLNCFLMPDGRPYFAGTYYPPLPAHQRPSWRQVLQRMAEAWKEQRDVVEKQAERLMYSIQQSSEVFIQDELIEQREDLYTPVLAQEIYFALDSRLDKESGGFGGAPKFPGTMGLEWLLDYYHLTGEEKALTAVELSLQKMIQGGLYDQLGGGFARYATDRDWKIPHFEKMLYDNALLLRLLAGAYQTNPLAYYEKTIRETLAYVEREMSLDGAAFYSALDADSEGVEGKFYLWTATEVRKHLGKDAKLFMQYYQMTEVGNWEESNILWAHPEPEELAEQFGMALIDLEAKIEESKAKLWPIREQRIRPGLDDKSLLDWNSLMVTAYAKVAKALDDDELRRKTQVHLDRILSIFFDPAKDQFKHSYKAGQLQYAANLSDYAFLIEALLETYSISFDLSYLERAAQLCEQTLSDFLDQESKQFYFTAADQDDLPIRSKDVYDSAVPNGGSTMVHNLLQLSILLDRPDWRQLALDILQPLVTSVVKYPSSFARWAKAILYQIYPGSELAVVGKDAFTKAKILQKHYLPGSLMMVAASENEHYPLLAGRGAAEKAKIFVCQNYSCQLPVEETEAALAQVKK